MSPPTSTHGPITVILIEDDPATHDRLTHIIRSSRQLELLGTASNAQEGYTLLFMLDPDVALIDLGLPDSSGIEIIRWLKHNKPHIEPLVITAFGDEYHVIRSLEAGASGYLLKDYSAEEIAGHIVEVKEGGSPISPMIARQLLTRMQAESQAEGGLLLPLAEATSPSSPHSRTDNRLTERELKVIRQVAKGFNTQEIGKQLGISSHTVATHVKRIYRKLQVSNRAEAVYEASASGLLRED